MDEYKDRPRNKARAKETAQLMKEVAKGIDLNGVCTYGKGNESYPTDIGRELAETGQHMPHDEIPDEETANE